MSETVPGNGRLLGPVQATDRILILDVLRGWAIFGIVLVNVQGFSGFDVVGDRAGVDGTMTSLIWFFARGKFFTLFATLFGLGFALQMQRAEARGAAFKATYLRRLLVLLGIGILHGLLDPLEVLHLYALMGLPLLVLGHRSVKSLLYVGLILLLLQPVVLSGRETIRLLGSAASAEVEQGADGSTADWTISQDQVRQIYSEGSLEDVFSHHWQQVVRWQAGIPWNLGVLSFFLFGLYLGRRKILDDVLAHVSLIRKARLWALVIGCAGTGIAALAFYPLAGRVPSYAAPLVTPVWLVGGGALGAFYACSLVLLFERPAWKKPLGALGSVGRMSLTNYLLQTLIATTLFYGYGFGLYGEVGAVYGLVIGLLIYALQVVFSSWWMGRFRLGPAEWFWRSLTYGKLQPMRDRST